MSREQPRPGPGKMSARWGNASGKRQYREMSALREEEAVTWEPEKNGAASWAAVSCSERSIRKEPAFAGLESLLL